MSDPIVIDDRLLLRLLLDDPPRALRVGNTAVWTTGLWYHRLCRALSAQSVLGSLSRQLHDAEDALAARAMRAVIALPEDIGLRSLRDLGWPMGQLLAEGVRLNLLSLEALAAAEQLGATLCLHRGGDAEPLVDAARRRGVPIQLLS